MVSSGLPPELKRLASVYGFINPAHFQELGIDPEDVPLGSFPAHSHPSFIPDRFGGNAYGLGVYESSLLNDQEAELLETLDLGDCSKVKNHYRHLNTILKRLGLLIRFTSLGSPFYLIPRQYVIHFSTEIQAKVDWIALELKGILTQEHPRVGLCGNYTDLLLGELQARLPAFDFHCLLSLDDFRSQEQLSQAVIFLDPPYRLEFLTRTLPGLSSAHTEIRDDAAVFMAGLTGDILSADGKIFIVCDIPNLSASAWDIEVQFSRQDEFKRFLLFSHIYRTKRRYHSRDSLKLSIDSEDFYTFLIAHGLYHEMLESMLNGRTLPQVTPPEIDSLPYQDMVMPLSLNSGEEQRGYWARALSPYFDIRQLENILPPNLANAWQESYGLKEQIILQTMLVGRAVKKTKPLLYRDLVSHPRLVFLTGCPQNLLAPYKNTFSYLLRTLQAVRDITEKRFMGLPVYHEAILSGALQSSSPAVRDAWRLVAMTDELRRTEAKLNPQHILGSDTLVLENLEKLAMLGLDEGVLSQIYLTVVGHSTLARVCFGKFPENSLAPLADAGNYASLEEAISVIVLCRLFSLAEISTSSTQPSPHPKLLEEFFTLGQTAIRVAIDPYSQWDDVERERESAVGGLRGRVIRKMLTLLKLFDFLDNWPQLIGAGSFQIEVLSDFNPEKREKAEQLLALYHHIKQLLDTFYEGDTLSRPYFFRAFLNCRLHGASRLLPYLGPRAAFNLLWICVHVTGVQVINLNMLPNPHNPGYETSLSKMRGKLETLALHNMSPDRLNAIRQELLRQRQVYLYDTGIYLRLEDESSVLIPRFLDLEQTTLNLVAETEKTLAQPLEKLTSKKLAFFEQTISALEQYFTSAPNLSSLADFQICREKFFHYLLDQIFDYSMFSERLQRLNFHCPHLLGRLLLSSSSGQLELAALIAGKFNSLLANELKLFQNMQSSYEAALLEFGPNATGIVGVSSNQFEYMAERLRIALRSSPDLAQPLLWAILLMGHALPCSVYDRLKQIYSCKSVIPQNILSDHNLHFLLNFFKLPCHIITGEAPLSMIKPFLEEKSADLLAAVFILSILHSAVTRGENFLTEDMLDKFLDLWATVENCRQRTISADYAAWLEIERVSLIHDALQRYLTGMDGYSSVPDEYEFKEIIVTSPPDAEARALAARERLLKICGLYIVNGVDVKLALNN
ncbi:MAG: hypothetical protein LBJ14_05580, partial [Desulfarculales bacterium]|nr:hypothetical protein [Desulfarculales bacterium]